ncbi:calmodulin (CAM)-binding protein of 25 kDa [Wolffia australiana]
MSYLGFIGEEATAAEFYGGAAGVSRSLAAPPKPTWHPTEKKISKRKSRASKRAATTYITVDVATFREMVQQVTGGRVTGGAGAAAEGGAVAAPPFSDYLPTLDTSSFLLESFAASSPSQGSSFSPPPPPPMDGGAAFLLEPPPPPPPAAFHCFPTLESWRVV